MIQLFPELEDQIDHNELWYLVKLARFLGSETRTAWPSHATMATATGFGLTKVKQVSRRLATKEIIEVRQRKAPGGRNNLTNQYRLITPHLRYYFEGDLGGWRDQEPEPEVSPAPEAKNTSQGGGSENDRPSVKKRPTLGQKTTGELNTLNPILGDISKDSLPEERKKVIQARFAEKIGALQGSVTVDAWAAWEASAFCEYWEGKKWKDRGRSILPRINNRIATWYRRGAEKAKYTKPAPDTTLYGVTAHRASHPANLPAEDDNFELNQKWEDAYLKFTQGVFDALGPHAGKVQPLTREQFYRWGTHQRRPLTRTICERNLFSTILKWLNQHGPGLSSYRLQKELCTTDNLLFEVFSGILKDRGLQGRYVESVAQ